ncbi:MAG TPA: undecaprenyl-diphosphate phosphatase [Thermoanaerobaculia bacterium]|nr:undecaprenyl-diphosphate phosphatase [Thermoanaerobaculia bacterium]
MTPLQALILAIVQGVTEFLPISSSAHLILTPYLFGWEDQGLAFDVATNTGTLAAVMLWFRRDLVALARGVFGSETTVEGMPPWRFVAALAVGTLPVAIAGLTLAGWIETEARNPLLIAGTSIGFGLLLFAADRFGPRLRQVASVTLTDALIIGLAQAVALVPGVSRSGITMTAALALGLTRPAAARFSFLLAIPVGLLATGYDGLKFATGGVPQADLLPMAIGLVGAAVSAYLVIGALLAWLERQTMTPFVVYRVLLGVVILALLAASS